MPKPVVKGVTERLNRGLAAVQSDRGVHLGWRLLRDDPADLGFTLYRDGKSLTPRPITLTTDFLDTTVRSGGTYRYVLKSISGGKETEQAAVSCTLTDTPSPLPFMRIPFQGKYSAQKVAVGDLDGDGELEFVIKQPDFNVDPYEKPGYWKPSEDTFKLEAYKLNGKLLWRYDMGWAIEEGVWYSPYVVYDIDGDGCAEVYTKAGEGDPRGPDHRVSTGPEYLIKIDGRTGQVVRRIPWISRQGYESYNLASRNFLAVAYVDGVKPHLIMERGTYGLTRIVALDGQLRQVWSFDTSKARETKIYEDQGAHGLATADIDGDGKDELVIGSAAIDHDGKPLWCTRLGHPDAMYVAHFIPDRPGLQIFYGIEVPHPRNSVCMVDARTGEIVWGIDTLTKHVHEQGMVGEIDPAHPGMACYVRESDGSQTWLLSSKGELLSSENMGGNNPSAVWWDADRYKELVYGGRLRKYRGPELGPIEGEVLAVADVLGDWREEIITVLPGELRIYTTPVPAESRNRCLLTDRQYREGVAAQSMGYYYAPQVGLEYGDVRAK